MNDITLSREEVHEASQILASTTFQKLMAIAEADYQKKWAAATKPEERELIWHLMHATKHVHQRLSDLVVGFKIAQQARDARLKPSDADLLRPAVGNGLAPHAFEE